MKIQKKITVGRLNAKNIVKILTSDINFLKFLGVMDYSFLVMKVNWQMVNDDR
jgi:hypothetical protein